MTRLEQQMNFIQEVDKIKLIGRQTYLSDGSRKENDAEHSWHLALMCLLLHEYANEEIDVFRVMSMVLVHDIIEIDAGDTYAYDEEANLSKRVREVEAAERIFHLLPRDQAEQMRAIWDEFEEETTAEAKFANALDKVQPTMLNHAAGGKAWSEHQVKLSQILNRNQITAQGSNELWKYAKENYIQPNIEQGNIIKDREISES